MHKAVKRRWRHLRSRFAARQRLVKAQPPGGQLFSITSNARVAAAVRFFKLEALGTEEMNYLSPYDPPENQDGLLLAIRQTGQRALSAVPGARWVLKVLDHFTGN